MKLDKSKISTYLPFITIPSGWAALGFTLFSQPGLVSTLDIFASSAQGNLRKVGVFGVLALFLLVVITLTLYWIDLTFMSGKYFSFLSRFRKSINKQPAKRYWLTALLLLALLFLQLSLNTQIDNMLDEIFLSLIQPLLIWGFIFTILSFLMGLLPSDGEEFIIDDYWKISAALFIIFFSVGLVLQLLGYGYTDTSKLNGNFDLTGYPILDYQVFLASIPALLVSYLIGKLPQSKSTEFLRKLKLYDVIISLALFVTAIVVWKAFPIQTHMFYDQPRPPTYEYFPNSDANLYDRTALNLLTTGKFQTYTYRFEDYIGRRPNLVLYLALLHKITQTDYPAMISLQQIVFSLIPVLIYLLCMSLHTRTSGILAGLLLIIRERNGLVLSNTVTGVHSQLLMSEIPTMMLLILFLIILNKTVQENSRKTFWAILAGGILGTAMLIRQEVVVLFPFITLGLLLVKWKKFKAVIMQTGLLLVGILLVISPWIVRNFQVSGKLYFDIPGNRLDYIFRTIGLDNNWWKKDLKNDSENSIWMDETISTEYLSQPPDLSAIVKNGSVWPENVTSQDGSDSDPSRFNIIVNHFTNQLVQSVVYLPSYPIYTDIDYFSKMMIGKLDRYYGGVLYSPQSYVKTLPYWWPDWNGKIPPKSILPVAGVVLLIAVGCSAAWKKERVTAIFPLFSYLGYISVYSLVRGSGGRFLQEIDWIALVYFSIGLVDILNFIIHGRGRKPDSLQKTLSQDNQDFPTGRRFSWAAYPVLIFLLLFAGSLPVIVEKLIPTSYPEQSLLNATNEILQVSQEVETLQEQNLLSEFLTQEGTATVGKAYYPRFFEAGENLVDIRAEVLGKMDDRYNYDRTEFYLIGSDTLWVVLKSANIPDILPNGSEVFAIGCMQDGALDAVAVFLLKEGDIQRVYWRDGRNTGPYQCPLQEPVTLSYQLSGANGSH